MKKIQKSKFLPMKNLDNNVLQHIVILIMVVFCLRGQKNVVFMDKSQF